MGKLRENCEKIEHKKYLTCNQIFNPHQINVNIHRQAFYDFYEAFPRASQEEKELKQSSLQAFDSQSINFFIR